MGRGRKVEMRVVETLKIKLGPDQCRHAEQH